MRCVKPTCPLPAAHRGLLSSLSQSHAGRKRVSCAQDLGLDIDSIRDDEGQLGAENMGCAVEMAAQQGLPLKGRSDLSCVVLFESRKLFHSCAIFGVLPTRCFFHFG